MKKWMVLGGEANSHMAATELVLKLNNHTWKKHVMNNRIWFYIGIMLCGLATAMAEPVSMPARSMEYYDLVAKVYIQSVDSHVEHTYHQSSDSELAGHPLHVELVETLRKTDRVEMSKLLVPAWTTINGRRYDNPDLGAGYYAPSNTVLIACKRCSSGKEWCVVEWVLTDAMWDTYLKQKETGVIDRPLLQEDYEIQQRLDAVRQSRELRKRMKAGEITREEYKRRSAPLTDILSQPIHGSTF